MKKHLLTGIAIGFSGGVNAGEADNPATYRVTIAGKKGAFTGKGARVLTLKSAAYGPAIGTVTLTLKKPSPLTAPIQVLVDGEPPSGLADSLGRLIDGNHDGQPGGDAIAILTRGGGTVMVARQPTAGAGSMPRLRRRLGGDHRGDLALRRGAVGLVPDRLGLLKDGAKRSGDRA